MKISERGRGRGGPFERMDHAQLIQGFSDQIKVADAHFLVSVIELTPFLKAFLFVSFGCRRLGSGARKRWGC